MWNWALGKLISPCQDDSCTYYGRMSQVLKPVLLFALQTTVETPCYDRQGKMMGRTFALPGSRKQVFRLPDDPKKREGAIDDFFLHIDPANPPRPLILGEQEDKKLVAVDFSQYRLVPIDAEDQADERVVFQTRAEFEAAAIDYAKGVGMNSQQPVKPAKPAKAAKPAKKEAPTKARTKPAKLIGDVALCLAENGKLTVKQIAGMLAELEEDVATAVKSNKFKSLPDGFIDLR